MLFAVKNTLTALNAPTSAFSVTLAAVGEVAQSVQSQRNHHSTRIEIDSYLRSALAILKHDHLYDNKNGSNNND